MNSQPTVVRISGAHRDAIYSFAMKCLSGLSETRPAMTEIGEIQSDDLRLVLDALSDTGNGSVELRILAIGDASRIFLQLHERAVADLPTTPATRLAAEACAAILDGLSPELEPGLLAALDKCRKKKDFLERVARRLEEDEEVLNRLRGQPDTESNNR